MNINQLVLESYLFSDKTISVDLYKFESGESKQLFIIGLCGSGKSTLGLKLEKKYNTKLRSTDECTFDFKKYYETDNKDEKDRILKEYVQCAEKMIIDNTPGIVEGVGMLDAYNDNFITNKSIWTPDKQVIDKLLRTPSIILGVSALKSSYRANRRNKERLFDTHFYKVNFQQLQGTLTRLRKDRTSVKGAVIKEFKV